MLYFSIATLRATLNTNNLVYLLPLLLLGWGAIAQNPQLWLPGIAVLLGLLALTCWLQFLCYRYRLTPGRVEVRSGVIARKHLDLPHERIQDVRFIQPIYYRLTDHLCVELDTAGSSGREARLVALPRARAEALKQSVMKKAASHAAADSSSPPLKSDAAAPHTHSVSEIELNTRTIGDLAIHGISSNRIWVMLAVLGAAYGQASSHLSDYMKSIAEALIARFTSLPELDALSVPAVTAVFVLMFLAAAVMMLVILPLFSVLGSIISYYDFRLTRADDRYIRRSGLFTRQEVSVKRRRLQWVTISRNWVNLLLGRANLRFGQPVNPYQAYRAQQQGITGQANSFLVPALLPEQADELAEDAMPVGRLLHVDYRPISKRYILSYCRIWAVIFTLTAAGIRLFSADLMMTLLPYIAALFAFVCLLVVLAWRRHGYAVEGGFAYVRRGVFGVEYDCLPIHKVQNIRIEQSFLQRLRGLCNLRLHQAGGGVIMQFIPVRFGRELADRILYDIEAHKRPWM